MTAEPPVLPPIPRATYVAARDRLSKTLAALTEIAALAKRAAAESWSGDRRIIEEIGRLAEAGASEGDKA